MDSEEEIEDIGSEISMNLVFDPSGKHDAYKVFVDSDGESEDTDYESSVDLMLEHFSGTNEATENFVDSDEEDADHKIYQDQNLGLEHSSPKNTAEKKFVQSGNLLFKSAEKSKECVDYVFKMKDDKCSPKCYKECSIVMKSMTATELECFKRFKGKSVIETKNNLLNHLKSQSDLGVSVRGYVLKGQTFCTKFFSEVTKVSEYILKTVWRDFMGGAQQYIHGNNCNPRESVASVKCTCWIKVFSQLYGQSAPDECTTVLPCWLTKATLFRIYINESTPPFVKKSNFYNIFKVKFGHMRTDKSLPHVRISKYSTHSVCPQCVALASYQKSCRTELELEYCKSLKFKHKERYGLARRRICEIQEMAITYPAEHLFISLDGMDNRKSDLPKFQQNVKNFGKFQKLPSHITGAIITSGLYPDKMKNFFFINHNQFEQGSNMVITIIYQLLQAFLKDHKKFPKYLHINTDNCGRENKNRFVFTFLSALVELEIFCEITMDFLIVGHTGTGTLN